MAKRSETEEHPPQAGGTPTARRRAAAALGDLLPEQTRDDSTDDWSEREPDRDEQLRQDVPPHHGS